MDFTNIHAWNGTWWPPPLPSIPFATLNKERWHLLDQFRNPKLKGAKNHKTCTQAKKSQKQQKNE